MKKKEFGQGLVSYALILVLIAIVVIAVLVLIGPDITNIFNEIICSLTNDPSYCAESGETSSPNSRTIFIAEEFSTGNLELDNVLEKIETLMEQAMLQEEMAGEGLNLDSEAFVESLEVLMEYAADLDNQLLLESLSQLKDEIMVGNYEALMNGETLILSILEEAPHNVVVNYIMKMSPLVIESCQAFSDGIVTTEAISEALFAVEQLDDDYPKKTEVLQSLNNAVDIIEDRNYSIEITVGFHAQAIDYFIDYLIILGEEDLATQLTIDNDTCSIP